MDAKNLNRAVAKIHGRAWADPDFRERLKKDPHSVLREHGLHAPDDLTIHVHESTDNEAHWVIPPRPKKLSDDGSGSSDFCSEGPNFCSEPDSDFCSAGPDFCSIADDKAAVAHPNICSI